MREVADCFLMIIPRTCKLRSLQLLAFYYLRLQLSESEVSIMNELEGVFFGTLQILGLSLRTNQLTLQRLDLFSRLD